MNKKLVVAIVASVVVIIAVVFGILAVTNNLDIIKPTKTEENSSVQSGDASNNSESEETKDVASSVTDDKGNKEFTVEAQKVKEDDTITVPVIIKNNPGFYAGQFHIVYDTSLLTYLDYEAGSIFEQFDFNHNNGAIKFLANNEDFEDVKKDGVLVYLKFKVRQKSDDYKISIQKEGTKLGNTNVQEVTADILLGDAKAK